ncbi:hypothetical protein BHM03_00043578 [Ensete ventricosum]|nr:hypothetical protein BHM03_00043578 [Ensete ventricosum]
MGSRTGTISRKNFRSVFRVPSRKFKILAFPDVLAQGKWYENGFEKKCDGDKLCVKSHRVEFRSVFHAPSKKFKILANPDVSAHVEFRSIFRVPSQKFKILATPDVLAHVSIGFSCTVSEIQNTCHSQHIIP